MKNNFNILTGRTDEHLVSLDQFLIHEDAKENFIKLQELAKEEINADLAIVSSFRSFDRQQIIWNEKALGKRAIKNDQGEIVDLSQLSQVEILNAIMRFSAIPGNSRHHWGTDIDIFDAQVMNKSEVQLEPWECEKNGPFYHFHTWLDEKIKAKQSFGFYRPYNEDLGGVSVEKWHLSYKPVAAKYFESYTVESFIQNLNESQIELKENILANAEEIFKQYFQQINL